MCKRSVDRREKTKKEDDNEKQGRNCVGAETILTHEETLRWVVPFYHFFTRSHKDIQQKNVKKLKRWKIQWLYNSY